MDERRNSTGRVFGTGSVGRNKGGRWEGSVSVHLPSGHKKRRKVSGATREEVEAKLDALVDPESKLRDPFYEPRGVGGDVYFIQAVKGGPIKIGVTRNVRRRLAIIQANSPVPLQVIGVIPGAGIETESALHAHFGYLRLHNEWFAPRNTIYAYIRKHAEYGLLPVAGVEQ
jgi:hypothetical protein